jgi:hypothetical protein
MVRLIVRIPASSRESIIVRAAAEIITYDDVPGVGRYAVKQGKLLK